jgi:hypothetical protein
MKVAINTGRRKRLFNGHGPNWKGGIKIRRGYVEIYMPNHPNARKKGYIPEHRLVMEKKLGRLLKSSELVHHINAVKDDNRPENLAIVVRKNHYGNIVCPCCSYTFLIK